MTDLGVFLGLLGDTFSFNEVVGLVGLFICGAAFVLSRKDDRQGP